MNKATWKAAHRLMRMRKGENFHHPLDDQLKSLANVAFKLRYMKMDSLAACEKFYTGKAKARYLFSLGKYW